MAKLLLILFVVTALVNYVFSIMILQALKRSGVEGGMWESRWHVHKHLKTYRELCARKEGTIIAYYGYQITFYGMAVFGGLLFAAIM